MATHLITGAGSGIGAEVARRLHDRGDRLVLIARTPERAEQLRDEFPGAATVVVDLADPDAVDTATGLPDEIDSLLHSAGVVDLDAVADIRLDQLRAQLDVNLIAPVLLTRAALPALRRARGIVVFVNSGAGLSAGPHWSGYAASKFGLRAVADALRAEEQASGVRVTTVFPSRTATPMQRRVHEQEGRDYDPARWIRPETVADTVLHVLSLPPDATISDITVRPAAPRPS